MSESIQVLSEGVIGSLKSLPDEELAELISQTRDVFSNPDQVSGLLERITDLYRNSD